MQGKNYFYFNKRDKTAVLFLVLVILLSVLVYILINKPEKDKSPIDKGYVIIEQNSEAPLKLARGSVVDVNSADTILLKKIPGIGSVYSRRIVKYRDLLGGFVEASQLREVYGIDEELYQKIKVYVCVEGNVRRLRINGATYKELIRHPYLNKKQVSVILDLSKRKGQVSSLKRLALLEEFSEKDIKRLEPYLSFE